MQQAIQTELDRIQAQFGITYLLVCESGSRAWDFASPDSDYDVRFVYFQPVDWYLQVFEQRDVIERPIDDLLDISGWELRKALRLLWRSNPALQEWLSSPLVYRSHPKLSLLQELARQAFLPKSSCHHYLALARRYADKLSAGSAVTAKAYLYALRALLCCQWVIRYQEQPPMRFIEALDVFLPQNESELRDVINQLLAVKAVSCEKDNIEPQPLLNNYIQQCLRTLEEQIPDNPETPDSEQFDTVFRAIIDS